MNKIIDIVCRGSNKIIRSLEWYREFWNGATKFWNQNVFDLDIVNLGSSSAVHAFDYSESNIKGANWALGPQSLSHDFSILKNYFSYIKEGGVVIIPLCPFSGLISEYNLSHNLKYYTFLHPATIDKFNENERIKAFKLKLNPTKEYPYFCFKNSVIYILKKIKGLIVPKSNVNIVRVSDNILQSWKNQFHIKELSAPPTDKHKEELKLKKIILKDMVNFCIERSLQPIIVIPPMHPLLSSQFPSNFWDNYMIPLITDLNIPIFNYVNDDTFSSDDYYCTPILLSKSGGVSFTNNLINRIKNLNIITSTEDSNSTNINIDN